MGEHRLRLRKLGLLQGDLFHCRGERRTIALDAGARRAYARDRLLRILHRTVSRGREIHVALVFLLREGLAGLIDQDGGPGGIDERLLRVERRLAAGDRRLRRGDVGVRLVERDLIVAVVDAGEDLAGFDGFIVANKNLDEIARDFRGDRRVVGLDIGVVRRDMEASDRPVIPTEISAGCEGRDASGGQKQPTEAVFRRNSSLLRGVDDARRRYGGRAGAVSAAGGRAGGSAGPRRASGCRICIASSGEIGRSTFKVPE